MSDIKIRLSMTLPGRVMLSSQECEKNPKENLEKNILILKGKKPITLVSFFRKCKPVKQVIQINKDAYLHMISQSGAPIGCSPSKWKKMNKKERLDTNLKSIAESFNAISYEFVVMED